VRLAKAEGRSEVPRVCTICRHERREEIDRALLSRAPLRTIADRWSVSKTAVIRHREHVGAMLAKAAEKQEEARGDRLLDQLLDLQSRTLALLAEAEDDDDRRTRLGAIREARSNLELIGRFLGELDSGETNINLVNVTVDEATGCRLAETYLTRHGAGIDDAENSN
jgi:hypothetical protein